MTLASPRTAAIFEASSRIAFRLRIDVFDEDLTVDDPGWACQANPLTADFLRGGGLTCQGAALPGSNILVDIRPN